MMRLERNMLIQNKDEILRILAVRDEDALMIDCRKQTMPKWVQISGLDGWETIMEEDLYMDIETAVVPETELSQRELAKAHNRYAVSCF